MARRKTRFSKKVLLGAIKGSHGIISVIASKLGCDWHTAKKNVDSPEANPEIQQAYINETDQMLDVAEGVIFKGMVGENKQLAIQTAKWYLMNKGKGRGYGSEEVAMNANVSFIDDIPYSEE